MQSADLCRRGAVGGCAYGAQHAFAVASPCPDLPIALEGVDGSVTTRDRRHAGEASDRHRHVAIWASVPDTELSFLVFAPSLDGAIGEERVAIGAAAGNGNSPAQTADLDGHIGAAWASVSELPSPTIAPSPDCPIVAERVSAFSSVPPATA